MFTVGHESIAIPYHPALPTGLHKPMFLFFHLFTGIVLGLLMGDLLHDRRWVIPFAIGAVLPDLIDKPIGNLFFADLFGNGRIFMHSLIASCALLVIGYGIRKRWADPAVLAIATGVLSHQVLDLMWKDPASWYYPLPGQFPYRREITMSLSFCKAGSVPGQNGSLRQ
jgi:membrane-bound metal-dependent hydrolase YbcI (DUF457 family)